MLAINTRRNCCSCLCPALDPDDKRRLAVNTYTLTRARRNNLLWPSRPTAFKRGVGRATLARYTSSRGAEPKVIALRISRERGLRAWVTGGRQRIVARIKAFVCEQRRELSPPDYRIFRRGCGSYRGLDKRRTCRLSERPFYGCASYRRGKRCLRSGRESYLCRDKRFFVSLNQLALYKNEKRRSKRNSINEVDKQPNFLHTCESL